VIKPETAVEKIDEREGWACHFCGIDAERASKTLDENGLAGAEWTAEQENLASAKLLGDLRSEIQRFIGIMRQPFASVNLLVRGCCHCLSKDSQSVA
jgi:hypothetical protein